MRTEQEDTKDSGFEAQEGPEYILVSDKTSKVVKSSRDLEGLKRLAGIIRESGGEVTLFQAVDF